MRGPSPTTTATETRHRLSSPPHEDTNKRRLQRNKVLKDIEKALHFNAQERILNCKPTLKLVMGVLVFGTFMTLFLSSTGYNTDHLSNSVSQLTSQYRWMKRSVPADLRYISSLHINWSEILDFVGKLTDKNDYRRIGLLNFNDNEIDNWKELFPDSEQVVLHLNYAPNNITWEFLYPEWIDEEQESEVPYCPPLPKLLIPESSPLGLVAVKLPCNKSGSWSRDVARFHLQLEAARLAALSEGYHPVHVLLLTDCFPIPSLFTCKDLVRREGNAWLYEPKLTALREKLQLPVGSCELAVPLKAKEHFDSEKPHREAYATILHSADVYVCGAIAAAQSIRMAGSTRDLVILVDETITQYHRGGLEAAGWKIHTIQRIRNPKAEPEAYNEWNYSKFRLWQLTDYDKIIFIDADMLILRNIDFLFQMPEISATGNNATLFNSGVMVVEPSNCTFQLLMDHINEIVSYNGGDQGYLNEVFTWWHRIPKHMNFLKHFWEGDEPEIKQKKTHLFQADPPIIYVLHYLGKKPWLCFRDYDCNWNVDFMQEFASDVAHNTWWRVHDAMPGNLQKFCLLRTQQKAGLEWDRRQAEKANYTDGHWKIKIKDKRLKTCVQDFCSWKSMLRHWGEKSWTDNATVTPSLPALTTSSVTFS